MRQKLIVLSIMTSVLLTACSSQDQLICPPPDKDYLSNPVSNGVLYKTKAHRNILPRQVALNPSTQHKHICNMGKIKINNYNPSGVKRQAAIIDDLLREKAASMGANAIINIKKDQLTTQGKAVYLYLKRKCDKRTPSK